MTKESSPKHKKWLPNEKGLAAVNLCYEQRTLLKTSRRTKNYALFIFSMGHSTSKGEKGDVIRLFVSTGCQFCS